MHQRPPIQVLLRSKIKQPAARQAVIHFVSGTFPHVSRGDGVREIS